MEIPPDALSIIAQYLPLLEIDDSDIRSREIQTRLLSGSLEPYEYALTVQDLELFDSLTQQQPLTGDRLTDAIQDGALRVVGWLLEDDWTSIESLTPEDTLALTQMIRDYPDETMKGSWVEYLGYLLPELSDEDALSLLRDLYDRYGDVDFGVVQGLLYDRLQDDGEFWMSAVKTATAMIEDMQVSSDPIGTLARFLEDLVEDAR